MATIRVLNKTPDSGNPVANIQVKSIKDLNFTHSYRLPKLRSPNCTLELPCFDFSKCSNLEDLKVYVYPQVDSFVPSLVYSKILQIIRESRYYTADPSEACLFILSIDTIDRDKISENYIRDVDTYISSIPQELWNEGRNHLIFNHYHGTFPDYSDHDLGFNTGNAIVARASQNLEHFRTEFDISLPLFHKEHPLKGGEVSESAELTSKDKYLTSFKGKRYVYGIGSETRDMLHHLHNGESIAMVTTCKHNTDWENYKDDRCEKDNEDYEKWNYEATMKNSTFCLTPRGRRLGSFRFLESLRFGCVPVVLSDNWLLPFSEIVNWEKAALIIPEKHVLLVPDILYKFNRRQILSLKNNGRKIYNKCFSSVEKITITTLEIIWNRILKKKNLDHKRDNVQV
ncbi:hypothetical protein WR25_24579 [Diploscapter pachys]|uniref:Exostosin GT47 domain-containing protein n=1 Tax=Diploscapter pachys TaxID=2018661 RepID=A0A2A2LZD0_9BILA|nr:hypothetical protein WR25_24579 [Diploscapter pachys]